MLTKKILEEQNTNSNPTNKIKGVVEKKFLCEKDGKEIYEFVLSNDSIQVSILNYGGIIKNIIYKGIDIVLGYDNIEDYYANPNYLGGVIGRVCNRISSGKFILNDKVYTLSVNTDCNSTHHGGFEGFNKKIFDYRIEDDRLILHYLSKDGEEGFPGNLDLYASYCLINSKLNIEFNVKSDKDTIANITIHPYFNLNGEGSGSILDHYLKIYSDSFLPIGSDGNPTGEIRNLVNTELDFNEYKKIGKDISGENDQLILGCGYDHNYILKGEGFRKVAEAYSDKTNIKLIVYTDQNSLQFYSSNALEDKGKGGKEYKKREAFCLEPQGYVDAINHSNFPQVILKKGEEKRASISFEILDL